VPAGVRHVAGGTTANVWSHDNGLVAATAKARTASWPRQLNSSLDPRVCLYRRSADMHSQILSADHVRHVFAWCYRHRIFRPLVTAMASTILLTGMPARSLNCLISTADGPS
jgi:hypothetical protein